MVDTLFLDYPGELVIPFSTDRDPFIMARTGQGYLAGTFPDGVTRIEGVPASATIRVLYRPFPGKPGDGVVVAQVKTAQDGTWRVEGLDANLRFDVVCRHDGYNDMILSNVAPKVD